MKNVNKELCRLLLDILTCILVIVFSVLIKSNMESVSDSYAVLKTKSDINVAVIKSEDNNYYVKNYTNKDINYKLVLVISAKENIDDISVAINNEIINIGDSNSYLNNDHYYIVIDDNDIAGYMANKYDINVVSDTINNYQLTLIM